MKIESIPLGILDEPIDAHRLAVEPNALNELADSIQRLGLLQPITVRPIIGGRYEIVAGHRRFLACRQIGRPDIECIVRHDVDAGSEEGRFAENLQRTDLTPMEEALAVTRLAEASALETEQIARKLNKSPAWVRKRICLMGIPDELKGHVHAGELAIDSAIALARVTDAQHRGYLARYAIEGGASAVVIREWVNAWEINVANGDATPAPLPDWQPGEAVVIVQIPCAVCGEVHDHRELAIVRVCQSCHGAMAEMRRAPAA